MLSIISRDVRWLDWLKELVLEQLTVRWHRTALKIHVRAVVVLEVVERPLSCMAFDRLLWHEGIFVCDEILIKRTQI